MSANNVAAERARLAELDAKLDRLRAQYETLMNRFKFEEARDLAPLIAAAEDERALLAEILPPPSETPPAPVRLLRTPRRRRR